MQHLKNFYNRINPFIDTIGFVLIVILMVLHCILDDDFFSYVKLVCSSDFSSRSFEGTFWILVTLASLFFGCSIVEIFLFVKSKLPPKAE